MCLSQPLLLAHYVELCASTGQDEMACHLPPNTALGMLLVVLVPILVRTLHLGSVLLESLHQVLGTEVPNHGLEFFSG